MTKKREVLNKLALRGEFMPQQAWLQIEDMANKLISSQALPSSIKNGSQLAMVFLAGYEAGMTPIESINSYYIVDGKVTIWGAAVLTQLRKSGFVAEWLEVTDELATVKITSPDGKTSHTETYTYEEAKAAGLTNKFNWKNYRKNMLRHRALGNGVRFFCPEVLGGHYLTEEIQDAKYIEVQDRRSGGYTDLDEGTELINPPKTVQTESQDIPDTQDVIDVEMETEDAQEAPEEPQEPENKLDPRLNKKIHANWKTLTELNRWDDTKSQGIRHKTMMKNYGVESNNDLTVEQAEDFVERIKEAVKIKQQELKDAAPKDDEAAPDEETATDIAQDVAKEFDGKVVTPCPRCKTEYEDDGKATNDVKAIDFVGMCNACIAKDGEQVKASME